MKINFFKYLILTFTILISLIIYLTVFGIETEKFNEQIKDKIFKINDNFEIDLKKIKLTLDPLNFKINAKTIGTTVYYSDKFLKLEYIKTQLSLVSIFRNKLVSSKLEIATKSIEIKDLIRFIRVNNSRPELFILENIIKNGHLILNLNLNFDKNGNIENDYELKGILRDGKIKLLKDNNFEKINLIFNLKKDNFLFKEIEFITDRINFFSDALKITKKKNIYLFEGIVENKKSVLTSSFLKLIKLNLKSFDFKNVNFKSRNDFTFEIDDKFKFDKLVLRSDISFDKIEYKKENFISNYFYNVNDAIILKNHELKLEYRKNKLSIKGEGKIQLDEKLDKIIYLISKNEGNFNFTSDLIIKDINLKKQEFLKTYFPSIKDKINLKDHKLNINFKNKKLLFSGTGKIKIDNEFEKIDYFISRKEKKFDFEIGLDLDKTNFKIDNLNYQKKSKVNTQLKIKGNFEENKNLNLINIDILENNNKIKINNLILGKNNLIKQVDKAEFDYLDKENKKNQFLIQRKEKNIYELNGITYNANSLITNLLKSNDEKVDQIFENNISLNLNLDEIYIDKTYIVRNLKGRLFINDNKVSDANISAIFKNKENLLLMINTDNEGKKITTLTSSWAKPLVNRYKFIKGFEEGYLDFYSSKKDGVSNSVLVIDNFKIKEIPVLAKLLSLASLQGIADLLTGEGIRFTDFEMKFSNNKKLMNIDELYAIGPSISLLMEGYVQSDELISLRGTLVPASTINRTIASIPLLGDLLIGKKVGEGVFGVSFKIKGSPKDLKTTVNPIKTLTPRFITRTLEKINQN